MQLVDWRELAAAVVGVQRPSKDPHFVVAAEKCARLELVVLKLG